MSRYQCNVTEQELGQEADLAVISRQEPAPTHHCLEHMVLVMENKIHTWSKIKAI